MVLSGCDTATARAAQQQGGPGYAPPVNRLCACWGFSLTPLIDKKALSAGRRAPPAPTAHDVGMAVPPTPRSQVGIVAI